MRSQSYPISSRKVLLFLLFPCFACVYVFCLLHGAGVSRVPGTRESEFYTVRRLKMLLVTREESGLTIDRALHIVSMLAGSQTDG